MNKLSTPKVKKGAKASGRYYRLKTLSKRMNEPGKSKPREKAAGKSINNDMVRAHMYKAYKLEHHEEVLYLQPTYDPT